MPIESSETSGSWKIVYIDCIQPGEARGAMVHFEVTHPDGKTKSVRPVFSMEFVNDYFHIPGDKDIDKNRSRIINEKEELFKTWGLVRIEEHLDQNTLEDEPKILSKDFVWAKKIEKGTLRPSSVNQANK